MLSPGRRLKLILHYIAPRGCKRGALVVLLDAFYLLEASQVHMCMCAGRIFEKLQSSGTEAQPTVLNTDTIPNIIQVWHTLQPLCAEGTMAVHPDILHATSERQDLYMQINMSQVPRV